MPGEFPPSRHWSTDGEPLIRLTVNHPIPADIEEVCVCPVYFFCNLRESPALLSPASLIYHHWISCNPLTSSPSIWMHKIRCKTTILQSILSIGWDFASCQLLSSLTQINSLIKILTGLEASFVNKEIRVHGSLVFVFYLENFSPGWCGSVDWAPACEPKGRRFNSWVGHMSMLWASPQLGVCKRQPIESGFLYLQDGEETPTLHWFTVD